jgi:hypothetical protein
MHDFGQFAWYDQLITDYLLLNYAKHYKSRQRLAISPGYSSNN